MGPKRDFQIEYTKMKQVRKFKYLGNILTEDGKCDTEIRISKIPYKIIIIININIFICLKI